MGGDTMWWMAAGIVLGTVVLASAAALSDTVRHRMHVKRQRSAPLPLALATPAGGAPASAAAGTYAATPPRVGTGSAAPQVPAPAALAGQVRPIVETSSVAAPPPVVPRPSVPSVAPPSRSVAPPARAPAGSPAAAVPPPDPLHGSRVAAQASVQPPAPPAPPTHATRPASPDPRPASPAAGHASVPPPAATGAAARATAQPVPVPPPPAGPRTQAPVPPPAPAGVSAQAAVPPSTQAPVAPPPGAAPVPAPSSTQVEAAPDAPLQGSRAAAQARVQPSAGSWVATARPGAGTVEIRVLGPLEVRAPGAPHGPYHTEAAALVAIAAVLPTGVPAGLVSELWPGPVAAAVGGRVREWLGLDAGGVSRLAERDGAWRLAADVRVDWHLFRALVNAPGSIEEAERLATALALIRGELLGGAPLPPAGRRAVEPHLAELRAVVINAVHRDVALARTSDDPARAEWALRQGRTLLPQEAALQAATPG